MQSPLDERGRDKSGIKYKHCTDEKTQEVPADGFLEWLIDKLA